MVNQKLGFVMILCLSLTQVVPGQKKCLTRQENIQRIEMMPEVMCMEPKVTLVTLPVPEGYDWVHPSVWKVKRCTGHMCVQQDEQCVGVDGHNLTIKVEAMKMNAIMEKTCTQVTVEEHTTCDCRCNKNHKSCGHNEVFHKKMCRCECKSQAKRECLARMLSHPDTVMWDSKSCTCPCNKISECSSGEMWVAEVCRCMYMMEENGEMMLMARA